MNSLAVDKNNQIIGVDFTDEDFEPHHGRRSGGGDIHMSQSMKTQPAKKSGGIFESQAFGSDKKQVERSLLELNLEAERAKADLNRIENSRTKTNQMIKEKRTLESKIENLTKQTSTLRSSLKKLNSKK